MPPRDEFEYQEPTEGAHAFLMDVWNGRKSGPFERVYVYCTTYTGDVVHLRNIGVEGAALGGGLGTAALEALLDLADGHWVRLLVQPHGEGLTTTERLDGWYRRLGFEECPMEGRLVYRPGSRHSPAP